MNRRLHAYIRLIFLLYVTIFGIKISFAQNGGWQYYADSVGIFSSPRGADLNGDGFRDIVIGAGAEGQYRPQGVLALDGKTGQILWQIPARSQVYGSGVFHDLNGDGTEEVLFAGRAAQLFLVDGSTGSILWEFWPDSLGDPYSHGWFNFYNPSFISDLDGDGIPEVLTSNGGDPRARAMDTLRPAGKIMILSGVDGAVLAQDTLPDGRETYHAPFLLDLPPDGPYLFFGSGGETLGGSFWEVRLEDFLRFGLTHARKLLTDNAKGCIASPSMADLNGDRLYDLLVPVLNERLVALDGASRQMLWEVRFPGTENYVSPTLGQFTGDPTPDIFTLFAIGRWGFYQGFIGVLIDGKDGRIVWQDTTSTYQLTCANALDRDGDGFDEVLLVDNFDIGWTSVQYRNQLMWLDFNDGSYAPFGPIRSGLNIFSTPLVTELGKGEGLSLVMAHQPREDLWYHFQGAFVTCVPLGLSDRKISWGGYLGTEGDGTLPFDVSLSLQSGPSDIKVHLWPNPTRDVVHFQLPSGVRLLKLHVFDAKGRACLREQENQAANLRFLPEGMYTFFLETSAGPLSGKLLKVSEK